MPQATNTISADAPFIQLQSVDSTNNYARQLIMSNSQQLNLHGTAVFAHEQVAGKGQRGKVWTSEKGANIALSILINPIDITTSQPFYLSACAAVAAHHFFRKYGGEDTKIKWPNDIYWQDRKAGGILIESGVVATNKAFKWAIIGIGFNINQTTFNSTLPNPVSLKQMTGKSHEPVLLAKELHQCFCDTYNSLITDGFAPLHTMYNQFLYKKNETVKLKQDNRLFDALIKEVNSAGQLVTRHAMEENFDFSNVEWVIAKKANA